MSSIVPSTLTTVTTVRVLPNPTTSAFPSSVHLSSPADSLYAQTLLHLANSLAKVPNPSEDRLARLVSLCPRLPPIATLAASNPSHLRTPSKGHLHVLVTTPGSSSSTASSTHNSLAPSSPSGPIPSPLFPAVTLTAAWGSLEKTLFSAHPYGSSSTDLLQSVTHSPTPLIGLDGVTSNGDGHVAVGIAATPYPTEQDGVLATSPASPRSVRPREVKLVDNTTFAPHAPLDDRSQAALLALLRYVLQANDSPHLPALLPLLLRYLLSLPYFPWHTRPAVGAGSSSKEKKEASLHHLFLSSHPSSPFASDLLSLLLALSRVTSAAAINAAVLITLRHLILLHVNTQYFLQPSSSLSAADRTFLTTSNYVLQGLLFALGEQSLVHDVWSGRELFALLLAMLKSAPSPLFHALTLRALVQLLKSAPFLFANDELTASLNPHIQSSSLTSYKRLTSPSSSAQHYSTLILTHSLTLSLLCALHSPSLKPTTLGVYKETLDLCLNSKTDDDGTKVMVGCVDVCECIMRGMISLAATYPDLIPVIIDTCRSILITSRRLASHPKQKALRALCTGAVGSIFLNELQSTAYAASLTRSFVQSGLSAVIKEDEGRDSEGYQRQLVLLLDVVAMLRSEEVSGQVIGLVLQRFSGRPRYLHLIIPQLTDIAIQLVSSKEVDSIVTLFINTYLNRIAPSLPQSSVSSSQPPSRDSLSVAQFASIPPTFSHSNLASLHQGAANSGSDASLRLNMEVIPIALARLAQGVRDEDKRVQMMKRMMRLFNDLAYEAANEVAKRGPAPAPGMSKIEACGALLPVLASLLCPAFYREHGNNCPNPAAWDLAGGLSTVPPVLAGAFQPEHVRVVAEPLPVSLSSGWGGGHPMPYLKGSAFPAAQDLMGVRIYTSRESNVKWFRRAWYILTHFDWVNPRQVKPTWTAAVRVIAIHSPVLLIDSKRDYLTTELDLEAQRFPLSYSNASQPILVKNLSNLLPTLHAEMPQFTLAQLLYLTSVYHLETTRMRSDSQHGFAPIFAYIADEDINKGGMGHAVTVLADSVFQIFVDGVSGPWPRHRPCEGGHRAPHQLPTRQDLLAIHVRAHGGLVDAEEDRGTLPGCAVVHVLSDDAADAVSPPQRLHRHADGAVPVDVPVSALLPLPVRGVGGARAARVAGSAPVGAQ